MLKHRRSIRVQGYDYSQAGAYFVTICTQNRKCLFGEIADGRMVVNHAGRIVDQCWYDIPSHFPHIALDQYVVMPNHLHGIIVISEGRGTACCRGTACRAPTTTEEQFGHPVVGSVPTIIRSFKSAATKRINEIRNTPGAKLWQRNFYERIIRNDDELNRIREYIANNPLQWEMDRENPARGRGDACVAATRAPAKKIHRPGARR
jgi:putative transposase